MNDYRTIGFDAWGEKCELCGTPFGLEMHHISGDREDNDARNLMPLCGTCHNLVTVQHVYIDPGTREAAVTVGGVFEPGPKCEVPPLAVRLHVTALADTFPTIAELRGSNSLLLLQDGVSKAFYAECHLSADVLAKHLDFGTLIDPRANDEVTLPRFPGLFAS